MLLFTDYGIIVFLVICLPLTVLLYRKLPDWNVNAGELVRFAQTCLTRHAAVYTANAVGVVLATYALYVWGSTTPCLSLRSTGLCVPSPTPYPYLSSHKPHNYSRSANSSRLHLIPRSYPFPFDAPQPCNYNFSTVSKRVSALSAIEMLAFEGDISLFVAGVNISMEHSDLWSQYPFTQQFNFTSVIMDIETNISSAQKWEYEGFGRDTFERNLRAAQYILWGLKYQPKPTHTNLHNLFQAMTNNTLDLYFQLGENLIKRRSCLKKLGRVFRRLETELTTTYYSASASASQPLSHRLNFWWFQYQMNHRRLEAYETFLLSLHQILISSEIVIASNLTSSMFDLITSQVTQCEILLLEIYTTIYPPTEDYYNSFLLRVDGSDREEEAEAGWLPVWPQLTEDTQNKILRWHEFQANTRISSRPSRGDGDDGDCRPSRGNIRGAYKALKSYFAVLISQVRSWRSSSDPEFDPQPSPDRWEEMLQQWYLHGHTLERGPLGGHPFWNERNLQRWRDLEKGRDMAVAQAQTWRLVQSTVESLLEEVRILKRSSCSPTIWHDVGREDDREVQETDILNELKLLADEQDGLLHVQRQMKDNNLDLEAGF